MNMPETHSILLLPGDGIGPEVVREAIKLIECMQRAGLALDYCQGLIGGAAYDACGTPIPEQTIDTARRSAAVLLGAVGAPRYEQLPRELRPERGLLAIRKALGLFANLRPALLFNALAESASLKPQLVANLDLLIIRELTGGIYFGEPRGLRTREDGQREAFNTMVYSEHEIERIGHFAYQAAQKRHGRLCSVDKANVLEVSELWRQVMSDLAPSYPDVELSHLYVDNAAMQLVQAPKQFDVIVTSNLFGDILSDLAAMLTGSIGMLPSASLNESGKGLYEPVHGSAPDIAGQGRANPLATILSLAMLLRYSLNLETAAARIEQAVAQVLETHRTPDIAAPPAATVTTSELGDAVVACYQCLAAKG